MATQPVFRPSLVAVTMLVAAPVDAAPPAPSQMGATSKASIEIRVSIAPRMGVAPSKSQATGLSGRDGKPLCVWSSAFLRTYTLRLQPLPDQGQASAAPGDERRKTFVQIASESKIIKLAPGKAVEAIAHPSAAACANYAGPPMSNAAQQSTPVGLALLILAPE